ncbi:MAG: hypothetical protein ABFS41_12635 [Myxococcota bacterium]
MANLRRSAVLGLLALLLLALGCVNLDDPFGNESDFRLIQKHFTQYVRWGKVRQAAEFVVPEQRQEFMQLGPDLTDIRFTDWETLSLEFAGETARAEVQLRGYRLSAPLERIVRLNQNWSKAEETGAWQVRLEFAALREGLGAGQ